MRDKRDKDVAKTSKIGMVGKVIPIAAFASLLLLGLSVYKDYGSFWDEGIERYSGIVSINAAAHALMPGLAQRFQEKKGIVIPQVSAYGDRYYGVILQIPMVAWEILTGFHQEKRHLWQTRHLFLFLFVWVSSVCLFLLLKKATGHLGFGLLGAAFFWLSPRFFAEAFYNVKDVGFLAAFIIGMFFLFRFVESPTPSRSIVFAAASAFAAGVRIFGAVLPFIAFGFLISELIGKRISLRCGIARALAIMISFAFFLVLFYPASWSNPPRFFFEAAAYMSHHPWDGNVLFMGEILTAHRLPWYYLPVWIYITMPLAILIFLLIGLIFGGIRFANGKSDRLGPQTSSLWLVSTVIFVGFLLLVVFVRPTLYDGWRHFYFLYAPMIILAVIGFAECWNMLSRLQKVPIVLRTSFSILVLVASFSPVCYWMIRNHPFQYVYFSSLPRARAFRDFEKDYWGVSEIKGLEYIMLSDPRAAIRISNDGPTPQVSEMLPESDRLRIVWVDQPDAKDYRLTTFRATLGNIPSGNEVFFVKVDGIRILSVVKNG